MPFPDLDEITFSSTSPQIQNSLIILRNASKSVQAFYDLYKESRRLRKGGGATTDKEQDLLRAMLLFASAGLDAVVKQLIKDCLRDVISDDLGAAKQFEIFMERKLLKGSSELDEISTKYVLNIKLLAKIVSNREPIEIGLDSLINDLTGDSLQSADQLLRVASQFAIMPKDLFSHIELVKEIFKVRNQITHEMDINLDSPNRSRRARGQKDMIEYTKEVLFITENFVKAVEKKINNSIKK